MPGVGPASVNGAIGGPRFIPAWVLEDTVRDAIEPYEGDSALPNHDLQVLSLLGAEGPAQVTFQGIKRSLDIHQESLSRALRRLQDDGLVQSTTKGYVLSPDGLAKAQALVRDTRSPSVPVLRTVLPGDQEGRYAAEGLRQRWFGSLRWYGYSQDAGGTTLSWTTEDGGVRLDARFEGVLLSVDARLADPTRLPQAIVAAHRLLYEVTQSYLAATQRALPPPNS